MPNNRYHVKATVEDQTIYVQEIHGSFFWALTLRLTFDPHEARIFRTVQEAEDCLRALKNEFGKVTIEGKPFEIKEI